MYNRGHNTNQYRKIQPPRTGPARQRVKKRAKSREREKNADYTLERYKKEMNLQEKLYEFFQTQGELKNSTALGQAFLALSRANQLWKSGKYAEAALMYVLVSSIVATYAPHMKDTMGMSHEDAPPMGDHKAMLEYHYPVGHPLHGKYRNDKDIQKVLKHFEKRAKVEAAVEAHTDERGKDKKCCPSCGVSCITFGGGRREMNWMDYSNKKTRKRRRKRGGAKTPKKGNQKGLSELGELPSYSSDEGSLGSDEQFPSLEELSRTPTPPLRLDTPSPPLSEKMKDPDYAAAYNRIQKRKKDRDYYEATGDGGNAYTPVGLYATGDNYGEEYVDGAGVYQWNLNEHACEWDGHYKTSPSMVKAMRSPSRRNFRRNIVHDSEKYTGQPGKLGYPGLYDSFKGIPEDDIPLPNLKIYPETRKGSLLDTGYINKKKPNEERIGNKGVSRAYPNEKLGGRKTRRRRGKGRKKKTRRIVCRKRKLTRKKRRRRR